MSWASGAQGGISGILKGLAMNFNPTLLKTFGALNAAFPELVKYFPGRWTFVARTPNLARGQSTVAMLMDMLAGRPGRGLWQVRFDLPHGGANFPHINFNMKVDPHTRIPPSVLEAVGKAPSWLGKIGKAAPWLAAGLDVIRLGEAFHEDGDQIGARTARTAGSVAGGWAGAWAGAEGGAVVGAAIGSIFPGPGTAIGGFVGAIGGGILGGLGGSSLGEGLVSKFQ
jgi:hypothetical protein